MKSISIAKENIKFLKVIFYSSFHSAIFHHDLWCYEKFFFPSGFFLYLLFKLIPWKSGWFYVAVWLHDKKCRVRRMQQQSLNIFKQKPFNNWLTLQIIFENFSSKINCSKLTSFVCWRHHVTLRTVFYLILQQVINECVWVGKIPIGNFCSILMRWHEKRLFKGRWISDADEKCIL